MPHVAAQVPPLRAALKGMFPPRNVDFDPLLPLLFLSFSAIDPCAVLPFPFPSSVKVAIAPPTLSERVWPAGLNGEARFGIVPLSETASLLAVLKCALPKALLTLMMMPFAPVPPEPD